MLELDPENLTFVEWSFICFVLVVAVFAICCWIDTAYQFQPY